MKLILLCLLTLAFLSFKKLPGTVAENGYYPEACAQAASSEEAFQTFKSNPRFNINAEYYTYEEGKAFLEKILSKAPALTSSFDLFRTSDRIGSPRTFDYGEAGEFSPTTLHYVKLAGELLAEFGSLDGLRIAEIGSGYGGLCKIIADLAQFKSYTLIDLPECLALAERVLQTAGTENIHFVTPESLPDGEEYDLVVSDYGFTLYGNKMQKSLIKKVLSRSKRGYLACNFFPKHFRVRPLNRQDVLKKLKDEKLPILLKEEEPLMGKGNFIITWICK